MQNGYYPCIPKYFIYFYFCILFLQVSFWACNRKTEQEKEPWKRSYNESTAKETSLSIPKINKLWNYIALCPLNPTNSNENYMSSNQIKLNSVKIM